MDDHDPAELNCRDAGGAREPRCAYRRRVARGAAASLIADQDADLHLAAGGFKK